jgi:1-acyl-sn-glycerol-3-phosphate acyltransferase
VTVDGEFPAEGALIANHLSYVDVVLFAALSPCVFCSKIEIASWPVVGYLGKMAGTVFVDRGRGGSALKAGSKMQAALEDGVPVMFFPEGTTTNGTEMLPFRSGLLGQVLEVGAPVTAAYLEFTIEEDNGPDVVVEDDVCHWGDDPMWPHVWKYLGLKGVRATVRFGDGPIRWSSEGLNRKAAAVEARDAVGALARELVVSG